MCAEWDKKKKKKRARECEEVKDRVEEREIAVQANMQGQQMVSVGLK